MSAETFTYEQSQRLIQLYETAERELEAEINRGLLRGNNTVYLQVMRDNCRRILNDLKSGSKFWTQQSIPEIYIASLKAVDRALGMQGGYGAFHQQAMLLLADNAYQRLENVTQVMGRQVDDIYRVLALENIRGSVAGYSTWKKVAIHYRLHLAKRGLTGFIDRRGRSWTLRNYSEMVAITSTHEALRQGTFNRIVEHGRDLAEIPRHANECERCRAWLDGNGNIISITGKTPGYPTYTEAQASGLFHPRCEHGVGAYIDLNAEIATERGKLIG